MKSSADKLGSGSRRSYVERKADHEVNRSCRRVSGTTPSGNGSMSSPGGSFSIRRRCSLNQPAQIVAVKPLRVVTTASVRCWSNGATRRPAATKTCNWKSSPRSNETNHFQSLSAVSLITCLNVNRDCDLQRLGLGGNHLIPPYRLRADRRALTFTSHYYSYIPSLRPNASAAQVLGWN